MKNTLFSFLFVTILTACSIQNNTKSQYDEKLAKELGADQYGMKPYVIVLLKTGASKIEGKEVLQKHFRGHMENIQRLAKEGKLALAGPFQGSNERNYRGMFIFNVKTKEEAEALVKTDPAVIAGVFDYEIYPWYGSAALPKFLPYHEKIAKDKP